MAQGLALSDSRMVVVEGGLWGNGKAARLVQLVESAKAARQAASQAAKAAITARMIFEEYRGSMHSAADAAVAAVLWEAVRVCQEAVVDAHKAVKRAEAEAAARSRHSNEPAAESAAQDARSCAAAAQLAAKKAMQAAAEAGVPISNSDESRALGQVRNAQLLSGATPRELKRLLNRYWLAKNIHIAHQVSVRLGGAKGAGFFGAALLPGYQSCYCHMTPF